MASSSWLMNPAIADLARSYGHTQLQVFVVDATVHVNGLIFAFGR